MKHLAWLFRNETRRALLAGISLAYAISGMSLAQDAPPPPPPPGEAMMMHDGLGHGDGMQGDIGEGKVVTGIPLTATIVVTRDQTLSDGVHIHKQTQMTFYRDGQGRVRRETIMDFGTPATGRVKHPIIMIKDPVSGKRYMLDPVSKTARELSMGRPGRGPNPDEPGRPGKNMGMKGLQVQVQTLGAKTIDGLPAEGRSVTRTIAAGEIGNDRPISVVTERWLSTELQIPVLVTHTDPMMGRVTTKVTNVNRGEPDASLFQIPSDYKMISGRPADPFFVPMQP